MGNCNTFNNYPYPDTQNVCTNYPLVVSPINPYTMPNACTIWPGNVEKDALCRQIGNDEWIGSIFTGTAGDCGFDSCSGSRLVDTPGCCGTCCSVNGSPPQCQRTAYNGDHTSCCFIDLYYSTPSPGLHEPRCFAQSGTFIPDPNRQNTCDPDYRLLGSLNCRQYIRIFALGLDLPPNDQSWINRWTADPNYILYALNRQIWPGLPYPVFTPGQNEFAPGIALSVTPDALGFSFVRDLITEAVFQYTSLGFVVGSLPNTNGFNPFQDTLFGICSKLPGLCVTPLKNACSNITAQKLTTTPGYVPWCGCYMPDDQYATYVNNYQLAIPCTPFCGRTDVIPLAGYDGITNQTCTQNACVIDNVNITLANTIVGQGIQFNQLCGGCTGSCRCVFDNINLAAVNSQINGSIQFDQNCAGTLSCFQTNSDGTRTQIPCGQTENPSQAQADANAAAQKSANQRKNLYIIIAIVIAIILLIVIFFLFYYYTYIDRPVVTTKPYVAPPPPKPFPVTAPSVSKTGVPQFPGATSGAPYVDFPGSTKTTGGFSF